MPAHIELIVRGEHTAIEHVHRSLEQRRPGPLQNHRALLREVVRQQPLARLAQKWQLNELVRPGRRSSQRQGRSSNVLECKTPGYKSRWRNSGEEAVGTQESQVARWNPFILAHGSSFSKDL